MIETDLANLILFNQEIVNSIGTYKNEPAIFIYRLPQNIEVSNHLPYLFFELSSDSFLNGINENYLNYNQLLKIIGKAYENDLTVYEIAEKLINLFRGYTSQSFSILRVSGPVSSETDRSLVGTQLELNITKTLS